MLSEIVATEAPKATAEEVAVTTAPVEAETHDVTPEGEQQEPEQKLVPLAALHEERQNRKQIQAELRQLREAQQQSVAMQQQRDQEWQVAQQRMAQIVAAQNRAPEPTEADDPIAYTAHVARQTQAQVQEMARQQQMREQQAWQQAQQRQVAEQQEQQTQALVQLTTTAEAQFATKQGDYQDAITYAKTRRVKELVAAGYEPQDAAQVAQREGWQLAHQWLTQGKNPAEMGYRMAQAMGYTPRTVDEAARAEMQEQGQRAAKPSGGGTVRGRVTAQQLAAMSPSQLAKVSEEDFRAAMGG